MVGIYKITNTVSQKVYIGQSKNIFARWKQHADSIANKTGFISQELGDTNLNNFSFSIIEQCCEDELDQREAYWIKYYNAYYEGYNKTKGNVPIEQSSISNETEKKKITASIEDLWNDHLFREKIIFVCNSLPAFQIEKLHKWFGDGFCCVTKQKPWKESYRDDSLIGDNTLLQVPNSDEYNHIYYLQDEPILFPNKTNYSITIREHELSFMLAFVDCHEYCFFNNFSFVPRQNVYEIIDMLDLTSNKVYWYYGDKIKDNQAILNYVKAKGFTAIELHPDSKSAEQKRIIGNIAFIQATPPKYNFIIVNDVRLCGIFQDPFQKELIVNSNNLTAAEQMRWITHAEQSYFHENLLYLSSQQNR